MLNLGPFKLSLACCLKMLNGDGALGFRLVSAGLPHVRVFSDLFIKICNRLEVLGGPMPPPSGGTLEFELAEPRG